jgi:hypothetical protein
VQRLYSSLLGAVSDGLQSFLVSVGAHLVFGGGLFYGIQKFSEEVEKKLTGDTKLEISLWLLDISPTRSIQGWRATFLKLFNLVFGDKHLSWRCFFRSCVVTAAAVVILQVAQELLSSFHVEIRGFLLTLVTIILGNIFPDYVSLWKTRYLIGLSTTIESAWLNLFFLVIDIILSFAISWFAFTAWIILIYVENAWNFRSIVAFAPLIRAFWQPQPTMLKLFSL